MKTKQCGNCAFWGRETQTYAISDCLYKDFPSCFDEDDKVVMAAEEGQDCPVYKEEV